MKLNIAKCKIGLSEVAYVGHVFGSDGFKLSEEKILAILESPEPENKKELQRFVGTVNYLGKFIPHLRGVIDKFVSFFHMIIIYEYFHHFLSVSTALCR